MKPISVFAAGGREMLRAVDGSIIGVLGLVATSVCLLLQSQPRTPFHFELQATSAQPGLAQLFYDVGRGFNEADSVVLPLAPGKPVTVEAGLPPGRYQALRLDPLNGPGEVTISRAAIVSDTGATLRRFRPEAFHAAQHISNLGIAGDALVVKTVPDAFDPITIITLPGAFELRQSAVGAFMSRLPSALGLAAAVLAIALGLRAAHRRNGTAMMQRHPRRAILAVAAVSVAWQMHPVLFGGRSMVSPQNGVTNLLYEGGSAVPGGSTEAAEWTFGSDVGAVMWQNLPMAAVARDAIFRDGELPLWDRYMYNGVPLVGQGISMVGNPLHALAIATDSAPWAWDLHYVIARCLFAAGIGWCVLHLGGSVIGAAAATATSAFIGYFSYRFNHMAGFSVCYAPWILVGWTGILRSRDRRSLAGWLAVAMLATYCVLTSGTTKEAAMLILFLHLAGVAVVAVASEPWSSRLHKIGVAAAGGLVLILVTTPFWLSFLSTLGPSETAYDIPRAYQIEPWKFAGFFEDLFYRQLTSNEDHYAPATNFAVFFACAWLIARFPTVRKNPAHVVFLAGSLVPLGFAFGLVPNAVVTAIPFIRNIAHVDNTFSCVLLVQACVLAGLGWDRFVQDLRSGEGRPAWRRYIAIVAGVLAVYFAWAHAHPRSPFFSAYATTLIAAILLLPWLALRAAARGREVAVIAALIGLIGVTCWRHGQYRHMSLDHYVANPGPRTDLSAPSPAVTFVRNRMTEPARVNGLGHNLFPGFNQLLRLEAVYGAAPLINARYLQIGRALGMQRLFDSCGSPDAEHDAAAMLRRRDFLNVRYYLAQHNSPPHVIAGLESRATLDLDVFESPQAWPRAFFTDAVIPYSTIEEFRENLLGGDGRPFAAVERGRTSVPAQIRELSSSKEPRTVVAAHDYRLTSNTTSFTVEASGPGMIVLTETFYPDAIAVLVDGNPATCLEVNHAFRGVYVDQPGPHRVTFSYRPPWLPWAKYGFIAGCAGLLALGWWGWRPMAARPASERGETVRPADSEPVG